MKISMKKPVPPRQKKWIDFDVRLQFLVDGYEEEDTMEYYLLLGILVIDSNLILNIFMLH